VGGGKQRSAWLDVIVEHGPGYSFDLWQRVAIEPVAHVPIGYFNP
jgi:hypothetical protein